MKKLLISLLMASLPVLIPVVVYLVNDPFMVIYHYNSFERAPSKVKMFQLNRDYVGVELLLNKYAALKYDSYIFGNSNGRVYTVDEWKKHISCVNCYHLDSYWENIFGIEGKMRLLHSKGLKIKNALFVLDSVVLGGTTNIEGTINRKHPLVSGESQIAFQLRMLQYFLERDCIISYAKSFFRHDTVLASGTRGYPQDVAVVDFKNTEDINEECNLGCDCAIARNADSFYNARGGVFYPRARQERCARRVISEAQLAILKHIKKMLDDDGTTYRFVISPLYNQLKLNPADLLVLQSIFGKDKIFDFSGVNAMTNDVRNYYEYVHYRPTVAKRIMDSIYAN